MIIAIWIIAVVCLAVWSLFGWGLHTMLSWVDLGKLTDLKPLIERFPYAEKISIWFPGWQDALHMLIDVTQSLLGWVGGAAGTLAWVVWGVGTVLLLGTAALISLLVVMLREQKPAILH